MFGLVVVLIIDVYIIFNVIIVYILISLSILHTHMCSSFTLSLSLSLIPFQLILSEFLTHSLYCAQD